MSPEAAILRRIRRDPMFFVREALGVTPTPYQAEITKAVFQYQKVSVASCHGIGKTFTAGGIVVPTFFVAFPGSEIITTAPTHRQVEGVLWKEIGRSIARAEAAGIPIGGRMTKTLWRHDEDKGGAPTWFVRGFTTSPTQPDKFQGWHPESGNGLVVVEEAAGLDQRIYDEGISSILSSHGSRLFLIGNPTNPKGEFRSSQRPGSGYVRFRITAFDTPNFVTYGITRDDIRNGEWEAKLQDPDNPGQLRQLVAPYLVTPAWVADRFKKWGEQSPLYQSRVEARFPSESANVLIPMYLIDQARERTLPEDGIPRGGCDPAGEGGDLAAFGMMWPSGRYRHLFSVSKSDSHSVAARVEQAIRNQLIPPDGVNVDSIGEGKGVYDTLSTRVMFHPSLQEPVSVWQYKGSYKAHDPDQFVNRRAEDFWRLRQMAKAGQLDIDPDDDELAFELSELRYEIDGQGRIKIESKDDFRKRTKRSPDRADAMAMAAAPPGKGSALII